MTWLKRLLAAGASVLAMTAYASADPISIGYALFAGPLGGIFSFGALVTASQVALYGIAFAVSAVSSALSRNRQTVDPGTYKNTFEAGDSSEVNAIGRVGLGGLKAFGNTNGYDRYRLICHARGPLVAVEEYKLEGREVTVEEDGGVSSPPYAMPSGSYVVIKTKVGDGSEAAWPDLIGAFPDLWTSAHRVRGIAQSLVKYTSPGIYTEKFGRMYQGGEPDLTVVARMNVAFDPREPGHDPDDETTWTWTDNGILCAARIMLSYPDLSVGSFDWSFIADEADRADDLVATLAGTEPRSRCSGVWLSESDRGDTMQQVLDSIGAEIVMSDAGLIRIRLIDDAPAADLAIDETSIVEWEWKSGPDAVERPNVCRVRYYSAERNYEMADVDMSGVAWARIQSEVDRYGEKVLDIDLPFCPSAPQAQRIARRMFAIARGDAGQIITNWDGLAAWGEVYVDISIADLADAPMLVKIAPPRIDDGAGAVSIPFVAWPDLPTWNPATMEAPAPEPIPDLQFTSELDTPAAPAEACQIIYPDASREIRVRFAGVSGGTIAEATRRTYSSGLPAPWASMTEQQQLGTFGNVWLAYAAADWAGLDADFRVRFFDANEEGSYWSPLLEARPLAVNNTAPSVPTNVHHDPQSGGNGAVIHATSPSDLHVAYLRFQASGGGGAPDWPVDEKIPCRPGDELSVELPVVVVGAWPDSVTVNYSITACASDGTASTPVTGSYTISAPPPG